MLKGSVSGISIAGVVLLSLVLAGCKANPPKPTGDANNADLVNHDEETGLSTLRRQNYPDVADTAPEFAPFVLGSTYGQTAELTLNLLNADYQKGRLGEILGQSSFADHYSLSLKTLQVLTQNKPAYWQNARKTASISIEHLLDKSYPATATLRYVKSIQPVSSLMMDNMPYWVKSAEGVNLRTAPSLDSKVISTLRMGTSFDVLGETSDNWLAVSRQGVLLGYVSADFAQRMYYPMSGSETDLNSLGGPLTKTQRSAFELQQGDILETAVNLNIRCQLLEYGIKTPTVRRIDHLRLCQNAMGAWHMQEIPDTGSTVQADTASVSTPAIDSATTEKAPSIKAEPKEKPAESKAPVATETANSAADLTEAPKVEVQAAPEPESDKTTASETSTTPPETTASTQTTEDGVLAPEVKTRVLKTDDASKTAMPSSTEESR
ncbi:SH3 domain-containing protein [Pokkaliibacter sp. CJK22405]|uniref:SH3 domain-containing protein n=1 Tax=Pokkaliibacter sp. CJK22405 TaxID=3384615 RepID=UPI003985056A